MKLILHNFRRCPFCIRTRMVLALKKIPHEVVEEKLRDWSEWMIDNVPDPRVPILRVQKDDGTEEIVRESHTINLWLDANFGDKEFTPAHGEDYEKMQQWVDWCDTELKPVIDLFKYGENREFDEQKHPEHVEILRRHLQKIENALDPGSGAGMTGDYLLGEKMTLADIAIIPFVRQIMRTRDGEFDFSDFPRVTKWTQEVLSADWFANGVMKKS